MKNLTLSSALILLLLFVFTSCEHEQVLPNEDKIESRESMTDGDKTVSDVSNSSQDLSTMRGQYCTKRLTERRVGSWGGNGGGAFDFRPQSHCDEIHSITICSGNYVDRFAVKYRRTNGTTYTKSAGGNGGQCRTYNFTSREEIQSADIWYGRYINRITLVTTRRRIIHGRYGGTRKTVRAGHKWLGFYGRAGSVIDRIGFIEYR